MAILLFGIHNHQPVDNFKSAVDRAIKRAYEPIIKEAEKVKQLKFNVHISGWLFQ